jgi:hypothetical protein
MRLRRVKKRESLGSYALIFDWTANVAEAKFEVTVNQPAEESRHERSSRRFTNNMGPRSFAVHPDGPMTSIEPEVTVNSRGGVSTTYSQTGGSHRTQFNAVNAFVHHGVPPVSVKTPTMDWGSFNASSAQTGARAPGGRTEEFVVDHRPPPFSAPWSVEFRSEASDGTKQTFKTRDGTEINICQSGGSGNRTYFAETMNFP